MSWLDALRGLAAMVVVFEHSLDVLLPEVRRGASPWFDFGRYGVFVFFLVSGYVVPFSLERRGSVRHFWAGRVFRLYPAWFVSAALALALGSAGLSYGLPAALGERPWASTLAHLTMLQDLLGVPNIVNVYWTLSYEMVFYLLVTAMFVAGVHRSSARVALGFGVGAAILGVALPSGLLASRWPGGTILAAALCLAGGLAAMVSRRRTVRRAGVAVVAALALGLLVLDSRIGAIESLCVIATMFAGTAIRGIQDGRLRGGGPPRWSRSSPPVGGRGHAHPDELGPVRQSEPARAGLVHRRGRRVADLPGRPGAPEPPDAPFPRVARADQLLGLSAAPAGRPGHLARGPAGTPGACPSPSGRPGAWCCSPPS
ncbi:acyltransferase family protein [Actinomadura madurae]|uniref:acyltransferase family protein n=1 Tax=Actinomadura madurae TaxID=1993 RepID=UPI0020D20000|nr:acyltransferase family protein [Actinomadura madurae]MCP9947131.1 acyltransferase family protein [Actinomadura madurae]